MSQTLCYPGHILQTFYTLLCLRILRYFEYFCFVWTTHIICTQVTIHESCVTSSWEGSWQCSPWRKPGIQNDSLTRWRGWPRMQHFNLFPTSPWKSVSNNAGSSPTEAEIQRCHAQQCMKDSQGTPDLQWDDVNHVNILRLTHADVCQQTCFSENLVLKHFQYIVTSFTSFLRRHPCTSLTSLFCQCPSPTWYLQNVMFQCFTNLQIIVWGKNWKLFVGGAGCLWETSRIIMSEWKQKSGLYCISLQSRFRMKQSIILVEGKP